MLALPGWRRFGCMPITAVVGAVCAGSNRTAVPCIGSIAGAGSIPTSFRFRCNLGRDESLGRWAAVSARTDSPNAKRPARATSCRAQFTVICL